MADMACSLAGNLHCSLHCNGLAGREPPSTRSRTDFESAKPRDFDVRPLLVIWEMTQACDLNCAHCRANARPRRHPMELSTAEAFHLIDQIAEMRVPLFVLSGGDPLKRPDLMPIIQYACRRGVRTSLTPSATPLLVRDAVFRVKESGLMRLALSLDASTAELHDGFRGVAGSYKQTLDAVEWCQDQYDCLALQPCRPRQYGRAAEFTSRRALERVLSGPDRTRAVQSNVEPRAARAGVREALRSVKTREVSHQDDRRPALPALHAAAESAGALHAGRGANRACTQGSQRRQRLCLREPHGRS